MESQPRNPEFRNNPENFHPCLCNFCIRKKLQVKNLMLRLVRTLLKLSALSSYKLETSIYLHVMFNIQTLILLKPDVSFFENTVDPDQLASNEAI